ncbi:manganese catalase family protein [Arthrobacter frigidicola]|nr:manganese catalase family protein [Arthrobacter frigidicola]
MCFHKQELQCKATPDAPDAVYARKLQEVLGGQYGEITVALQYSFQAWNAHVPGKYRDLLFGIGAEEFGYVVDSMGNPWQGSYITASGNLLADFTANANAEMQGRLQVARLYHMTNDHGVRAMLSFLLARDTMHQNQWMAAARELQESKMEELPVPSNFPLKKEAREVSYQYLNFSDGKAAAEGSWASGPTPDGKGEFSYPRDPRRGLRCRRRPTRTHVSTAPPKYPMSWKRLREHCRTN